MLERSAGCCPIYETIIAGYSTMSSKTKRIFLSVLLDMPIMVCHNGITTTKGTDYGYLPLPDLRAKERRKVPKREVPHRQQHGPGRARTGRLRSEPQGRTATGADPSEAGHPKPDRRRLERTVPAKGQVVRSIRSSKQYHGRGRLSSISDWDGVGTCPPWGRPERPRPTPR